MGRLAKQVFTERQENGCCPICGKFRESVWKSDEAFKKVLDNQYGNVWICPNHNVELIIIT